MRWRRLLLLSLLLLAGLAAAAAALLLHHRARGFYAPVFAPDGRSVLLVVRDVRAVVLGFGYETFTPPASVSLLRDRFYLARLELADGRLELLQEFPASPLEGTRIRTYRTGLYGSAHAHLRREGAGLEYELRVTRPDQPTSTTFVLRGRWPASTAPAERPAWQAGTARMVGAEPARLLDGLEVLAVGGAVPMPCAVVLLSVGGEPARPLVETPACRERFPDGYDVPRVREQSVRSLLERQERLARARADLLAEARRLGLPEHEASLYAIRGMQRLGLYPKPTQIVAVAAGDDDARPGEPIFEISDREFQVGLFTDIREALEQPGEPADKHSGRYIVHDDFTTSRELNAWLAAGETSFLVRARGRLWRLTIERP